MTGRRPYEDLAINDAIHNQPKSLDGRGQHGVIVLHADFVFLFHNWSVCSIIQLLFF